MCRLFEAGQGHVISFHERNDLGDALRPSFAALVKYLVIAGVYQPRRYGQNASSTAMSGS